MYIHTQAHTTPHVIELLRIKHNTNHEHAAYLREHVIFNDRYDNLLYEAAKKIFSEEVDFIEKTYNTSMTDQYPENDLFY